MANYHVLFDVYCSACGQVLERLITENGVEHRHGNPDDCDQASVTLPAVTPEQLSALFSKKKASKAKAAPKKK
jgi:hypothetical protein